MERRLPGVNWPDFEVPPLPPALRGALTTLAAERKVGYQEGWEDWFHHTGSEGHQKRVRRRPSHQGPT